MNDPVTAARIQDGYALFRSGDKQLSLTRFEELRSEFPDDAQVWLHSAIVLDYIGQWEEAVPFYKRAMLLGLSGNDARDATVALASSLRSLGRTKECLRWLQRGAKQSRADVVMELFSTLMMQDAETPEEAIGMVTQWVLRRLSKADLDHYRAILDGRFGSIKPG